VCGPIFSSETYNDLRRLCANVATASAVLSQAGSKSRDVTLGRRVLRQETRATLSSRAAVGDGYDDLITVGSDGAPLVLLFPALSLFDNNPGDEDFHPELPIGILVAPELVAERNGLMLSSASRGPATRAPSLALTTRGLTPIESGCSVLDSDGDGVDETGDAYQRACWHSYKNSSGDANPNYKWRLIYVTGSSHGGNFDHHLRRSFVSIDGNPDHLLDEWSPTETIAPATESAQITLTLMLSSGSVAGSASHTFTIYQDAFGPRSFGSSDDYFKWGWSGNKGCGGSTCSYVGLGGGGSFKLPQTSSLGFIFGQHISWGL
jgi:hypothetical protein